MISFLTSGKGFICNIESDEDVLAGVTMMLTQLLETDPSSPLVEVLEDCKEKVEEELCV